MWRIGQRISKSSQCFQPVKAKCVQNSRLMCTQNPPKAEGASPHSSPSKVRFLLKFLGVTLIGAGGVVGYAWYDSEFRKTLEDNVPYSKDALNYMFSYIDASKPTQSIEHTRPSAPVTSVSDSKVSKVTQRKDNIQGSVLSVTKDSKEIQESSKEEKEKKKPVDKEQLKLALLRKEEEEAAQNRELEVILERLLRESKKSVESALTSQKSAAEAINEHTKKLKHAMENTSSELEWEETVNTHQFRTNSIWNSDRATEQAKLELEKLRSTVADSKGNKVTEKNKILLSAEEELNKLNYILGSASTELSRAHAEAKVMAEYRDLVKKGKERFRKELESILPDVKIGQNLLDAHLTENELNSLIAHAHRRIDQLQKQLAEQQVMEHQRIEKALMQQKEADNQLTEEMISRERDRMTAELEVIKQKWDNEAHLQFEIDLRAQLARQAAAHSDHIFEVLKVHERELAAKFQLQLSEVIQKEKETFQQDVSAWVARLHGIEAALDSRAEMEKQGRKAQELWLACQTLQNVVDNGKEGRTWEEQLKPLNPEITAIQDASCSNMMIATILEAVPEAAIRRGVWTETALVERFQKVNKICRRVAMIDETGGSLFKFFISYIQSFFVFRSSCISELEELDPSSLSTFALLDSAHHSLEHGNLEQAVRYINQLHGEPRRVAADWLQEARLRLETKQASDVLLSYASAIGLGSLF